MVDLCEDVCRLLLVFPLLFLEVVHPFSGYVLHTQPFSVPYHFSSRSSSLRVDLQCAVILYPSNGMVAGAQDF